MTSEPVASEPVASVFLPFEEQDLTLMPLSSRRALDHAGLKLSLVAWQGLDEGVRGQLARAGANGVVDVGAVRRLVEHAAPAPRPIEPRLDPDPMHAPEGLRGALGLDRPLEDEVYRALRPLARYALHLYAGRQRLEKLAEVYDDLVGRGASTSAGRSQSSR